MKKIIIAAVATLLLVPQAFATYYVVLKDGTKYRAQDRWTMVNGKALISLENGSQLQIDPTLIDAAKTDAINKSGMGDVTMINTAQPSNSGNQPAKSSSELGSFSKLKGGSTPPVSGGATLPRSGDVPQAMISSDVIARFGPVYENVGIFGSKTTPTGPTSVRVELVADNETQAFNAISATAYMLVKLPTVANTKLTNVELNMTTIKQGNAGKFNMTAEDAEALQSRKISLPKYYVDKVIF